MSEDSQTATQLIDALMDEGEQIDAGSFSIDLQAAGEKLDTFQYADRSAYLPPLIEGLVALGARRIGVRVRGADLFISAEGVTLDDSIAALAKLGARKLGASETPRERALARMSVALDMVRGCEGLERVLFAYDTGAHIEFAEFRTQGPPRLARGRSQVNDELRVVFDYAGFGLMSGRKVELEHLRRAVEHCPVPVLLDDELISQIPGLGELRRSQGEGPGYRFELWLRDDRTRVELFTLGLRIGELDAGPEGVLVHLELDAPRWDLSQTKIVRDETIDAALEAIGREHVRFAAELERQAELERTQAEQRAALAAAAAEQAAREAAQEAAEEREQDEALYASYSLAWRRAGLLTYLLAFTLGVSGHAYHSADSSLASKLLLWAALLGIPGSRAVSVIVLRNPRALVQLFVGSAVAAWLLGLLVAAMFGF